jgi:hypothetical protein
LIQYTHMRRGAAWPLLLRAVLYRPVLQRDRFEQCHRKWDECDSYRTVRRAELDSLGPASRLDTP